MKQVFFDMHVHSDNSPDGFHSITRICEKAAEAGLRAFALTDHCECNLYESDDYRRSVRQSRFEAVKAKKVFSGQLLVLSGVELGQPLQNPAAAAEVLSAAEFDFVLCSLHNVAGKPDFYYIEFDDGEHEPNRLLRRYFDELLQMCETADFDALAHLTYPLRYIVGTAGIAVDMSRFAAQTDRILSTLAERGKALEINVSGLRGPFGRTMPEEPLVRRFRELGGRYVTVGSDAHRAEHVGTGIREGIALAARAGFSHITLYEHREPVAIPIAGT